MRPDAARSFIPALLTIFLFLVALVYFSSAFDPFEPAKTVIIRIFCLGVVFAWLGRAAVTGGMEWMRTRADRPMVVLLLWCALSFFYTNHAIFTLNELSRLACCIVLYMFVAQSIKGRAGVEAVVRGALIISIPVAALGLLELLKIDMFPWDHLLVNRFFSIFSGFDKAALMPAAWANDFDGRISSSVGNPVYLAGYVVLLLPAALAMYLYELRPARIVPAALALAGLIFCLVACFTRSAWGVCAVSLAMFGAMAFYYMPRERIRGMVVRLLAACIFTGAMIGVFSFRNAVNTSRFSVVKRVAEFSVVKDDSLLQRALIWKTTWEMVKAHPLRGVGLGDFPPAYPYYQKVFFNDPKWLPHICFPTRAHNDLLEMWAETGAVGAGLFAVVLIIVVRNGFWGRKRKTAGADGGDKDIETVEEQNAKMLGAALASGLAAVVVYSCFQFPFHVETTAAHFWVFAGLLAALDGRVARGMVPKRVFDFSGAVSGRSAVPVRVLIAAALAALFVACAGVTLRPLGGSLLFNRGLWMDGEAKQPVRAMRLLEAGYAAYPYDPEECGIMASTVFKRWRASGKREYFYLRGADVLNDCLTLNPNDSRLWSMLGRVFLERGQARAAADALGKSVAVNPLSAEAFYNLGIAYSRMGNYNESVKALKRSLELFPGFVEAYLNLGDGYWKLGRYDEALGVYRQALELNPAVAPVYNTMGSILQDKGDMKQAEEYYLRAIRQNPDFLDARGNLAILYNRNGRAGEAEKVLNYVAGRAVNERPDLLPIALYHLGEVYRSEGRLAEAVSAWRRTVEIAPSFKAAKKRLDEVSGKNVSGKH